MIHHILLSILAIITLLLTNIDVAGAEESGEPMIVVLREEVSLEGFGEMYRPDDRARLNLAAWNYLNPNVVGAVQVLERRLRFRADHVYSAALRGFAARLTAQQISAIETDPLVDYVEPDNIATTKAQEIPWGIDRIEADLSSTLAGNGSGAITTVNVYIIDSGIDLAHGDLNLVGHVKTFPPTFFNNRDCNGHGTHVAGTVAAIDNGLDVVGVAPGAPLFGVKAFNCIGKLGIGQISNIIKGVDLVTANGPKPGVVNMSLGTGVSQALDDAIINSVNNGFFYAVAAGNEAVDACTQSPARAGLVDGVVTVAAIDINEQEADFSNFGSCVDIWAPGVDVLSTALGGGTRILTGTSMASPHVAGAAALFLSANPTATPAQVEAAIKAAAVSTGTTSKDGRAITRLNVGGF
jgi:subtilisin family serine protease